MNIRISQIPPISGNLEDLDLLELSEYVGPGSYRSHSVAISSFKTDLFDWIQEDHQLDIIDITSGAILLAYEPRDPDTVSLQILAGPISFKGIDYDMDMFNNQLLTWNGYTLSGELEIGDVISIRYVK